MDKDINRERVTSTLRMDGIDFDTLKPAAQEWLLKIDAEITRRSDKLDHAVNTLKDIEFDIISIAKSLGTTRQTLYSGHSGVLKRYIDLTTPEIMERNPLVRMDRILKEKSSMQNDIDLMMIRDVKAEVLAKQLDDANKKLSQCNNNILELRKRNAQLAEDNHVLQVRISKLSTEDNIQF